MNDRNTCFVCASGLAVLLLGLGELTSINPTTGLPVQAPTRTAPVLLPPGEGAAIEVLWDASHGVELDYVPAVRYSDLTAQLATEGFHITTTDASVDTLDLSPYSVVVLAAGSAWLTPYTASEVAVLRRFARGGGGILIMTDNVDVPDQLEAVTDAFFMTGNEDMIQPLDLFFTAFADHPIFDGVQQIYYRAAGTVHGDPPSVEVARTFPGEPVVVSASGLRVVLLGDINAFENDFKGIADNTLFASNVFAYLAGL